MTPSAQSVAASAATAAPGPAPHAHGHPDPHPQVGPYGYPDAPAGTYAYPARPVGRLEGSLLRLAARAPRWGGPLAVLVCFLGGVAYVLWSDPTDADAFSSPSCLLKLTTGLDCPGCGGTRAMWYLLHGNVPAAARHHAVAVFAAPFLVYAYVEWTARVVFDRRLPPLRFPPRAGAA
jgi:hypothetical protein